jgi:hypothetical protein
MTRAPLPLRYFSLVMIPRLSRTIFKGTRYPTRNFTSFGDEKDRLGMKRVFVETIKLFRNNLERHIFEIFLLPHILLAYKVFEGEIQSAFLNRLSIFADKHLDFEIIIRTIKQHGIPETSLA